MEQKITCENQECKLCNEGYCMDLTYDKMLKNKISCEERVW